MTNILQLLAACLLGLLIASIRLKYRITCIKCGVCVEYTSCNPIEIWRWRNEWLHEHRRWHENDVISGKGE